MRPARRRLLGLLVLACGVLVAGEALPRLRAARGRLELHAAPLYFPSSRTVAFLALGHRSTLADMLYLWSIQYFGDERTPMADRRAWLFRVYDTITDLDPRFRDAYWLGFVSLLVEARSPDEAFRLVDKALAHDPGYTWMAVEGAITARRMGRHELAVRYLRQAASTGDSMAKRFLLKLETLQTSQEELAAWRELTEDPDELTRSIAASHVRDLEAFIDVTLVSELARCFARERGLAPASLEQLVTAGYLGEIPRDPEGVPYVFDRASLSARSVTPYRHHPPSRAARVDLSGLGRCAGEAGRTAADERPPP